MGADLAVERKRGALAAAIGLARRVRAALAAFRRIDAEKTDPAAMNIDRIAVDHGGLACNVGRSWRYGDGDGARLTVR